MTRIGEIKSGCQREWGTRANVSCCGCDGSGGDGGWELYTFVSSLSLSHSTSVYTRLCVTPCGFNQRMVDAAAR